jgi:hypothetical protein
MRALHEAERLIGAVQDGILGQQKFWLHEYRGSSEGAVRLRGRIKLLAQLAGRTTLADPSRTSFVTGRSTAGAARGPPSCIIFDRSVGACSISRAFGPGLLRTSRTGLWRSW